MIILPTLNPVQNILRLIKKSSKARQDLKTLIAVFFLFMSARGETDFARGDWTPGRISTLF